MDSRRRGERESDIDTEESRGGGGGVLKGGVDSATRRERKGE